MTRCVKCQKVSPDVTQRLCSTVEDRCRIPWKGGAIHIRPDVVFPLLVVPCCILLASVGPVWTVMSFTGTFALLFAFYRAWRRRHVGRRRTSIFFVFSITSIVTMCYTFVAIVMGYREIFLWEILLLFAMLAAMVYYLFEVRRDPGIVVSDSSLSGPTRRRLYSSSEDNVSLSDFEVVWIDSRPIISECFIYFLHIHI